MSKTRVRTLPCRDDEMAEINRNNNTMRALFAINNDIVLPVIMRLEVNKIYLLHRSSRLMAAKMDALHSPCHAYHMICFRPAPFSRRGLGVLHISSLIQSLRSQPHYKHSGRIASTRIDLSASYILIMGSRARLVSVAWCDGLGSRLHICSAQHKRQHSRRPEPRADMPSRHGVGLNTAPL